MGGNYRLLLLNCKTSLFSFSRIPAEPFAQITVVSRRQKKSFEESTVLFCLLENSEKLCKLMATQCGNYGNLLSRYFGKNFVKTTHLLNRVDLTEKNFGQRKFFVFPQCATLVVKFRKINFLTKKKYTVNHREKFPILPHCVRVNFRNFHTVWKN